MGTLTGKCSEVAGELWQRRINMCAVHETRWKGEAAWFVGTESRKYKLRRKGMTVMEELV